MSWAEVADELNARGLVTRRGNAWNKSSIYTAVEAVAGSAVMLAPLAAGLLMAGSV
jgi:hypothetical protein